MRAATFNVLADAYTSYGDYSQVDPELLVPGARIGGLVRLIDSLDVDVIGLQEAEKPLVDALDKTGNWQTFWSPKERGKPDGCLTLVKPGIDVSNFDTHPYRDRSGHILQILQIGKIAFANTHIKWAPIDAVPHIGVNQTNELLETLGPDQPAVIFADSNDRPNGPVRRLVKNAGFTDMFEDTPTALVDQHAVAIDLLAVRGVAAKCIATSYTAADIPNHACPSDHIPLVAELD